MKRHVGDRILDKGVASLRLVCHRSRLREAILVEPRVPCLSCLLIITSVRDCFLVDSDGHVGYCQIFVRAIQAREPFPARFFWPM